jgi:hypothetical protein
MKKFSLSLVAGAVSVLSGGALASVDFRPGATAAETRMASELSYASSPILASSGRTTVAADLGFGVNNAQQRHIKVTLSSGATFASATAGSDVTFAAACSGTTAAWVGGGLGQSFVIYQVTGGTSGCTATDDVTITLPGINVATNSTVTAQYQLFDGAPDAVAGANALYSSATTSFLTFVNGLVAPVITTNSLELGISGTPNFSNFKGTANGSFQKVGQIVLSAASGVSARSGAVTLADLSTATSNIKIGASNYGTGTALRAHTGTACPTGASGSALTINSTFTQATYTVGTEAGTYSICWSVDGSTAIQPQTVTANYDPVATSGSTLTDPAQADLGTITREGTVLMSPYVTINPAYVTNFTFTNSSNAAVTWRATVTPQTGGTCAAGTTSGTIPANGITVFRATSVCPSISGVTAAGGNGNRAQFSFSIEAPSSSIQGSMTTADAAGTTSPNTMLMIKNGAY